MTFCLGIYRGLSLVKYQVEIFLMITSVLEDLDNTLIFTKCFLGAVTTIMQIQNKLHKKLINVIVFIYQMYKLYRKIFWGGGGRQL